MADPKYYRILGVSVDVSADEVRRAYLLRAKMQHPDLFNPLTQPEEWKRANDRLRELNEAYAQLRAAALERGPTPSTPNSNWRPSGAPPPPPPRPGSGSYSSSSSSSSSTPPRALGPLKPGITFWDSMGPYSRARLKGRQAGTVKPQLHVKLNKVTVNLVCASLSVLWLIYLLWYARLGLWSNQEGLNLIWISVAVGVFCAWNVILLVRYYRCALRNGLFVTPLYVIRIHRDQVRYYPIWELRDLTIKHRAPLGRYWDTGIELIFASGAEKLRLRPKKRVDEFQAFMRTFEKKAQEAKDARDVYYFSNENDFRESPLQEVKVRKLDPQTIAGCSLLCLLVFAGAGAGLETYNESLYHRPNAVAILAKAETRANTLFTGATAIKGANVDFETDPVGALVSENRIDLGRTPLHLVSQLPGPHRYVLRYADWPQQAIDQELRSNQQQLVSYAWPHGSVRVETTPPGAHVTANGTDLGVTPLTLPLVSAGHVDYALTMAGFAPLELTGEVAAGQALALNAKLVDLVHEGSIRLKLGADKRRVNVTNTGDNSIVLLKADLDDADYKVKETVTGPWTLAPGAEQMITFSDPRADFDFYSFASEPKNLAIEIQSETPGGSSP
jgi:hypothetical protein